MNILAVLPLAVVMVAGPQIISSFFFATGEKWRGDSAAYVFGAAIGLFAVITIAYLLASGSTSGGSESESGSRTLDFAIVALLLLAMAYVFTAEGRRILPSGWASCRRRLRSPPSSWGFSSWPSSPVTCSP